MTEVRIELRPEPLPPEESDLSNVPLPPEAVYARPRKRDGKYTFVQEACACCTHTEPVDLQPTTVGECTEHLSVKSRFSIRNICCDSEVRLIERIVTPLEGVETVSINSFQKLCVVTHCPSCSTPDSIVAKLNGAGLGAALLGQGNLELDTATRSVKEMLQEHARYVIVVISSMLMILGVLCTGLPVNEDSLLLLALFVGLGGIMREALLSLVKCTVDISTLVVLAAVAAAMQKETADAALVVLLFNVSKVVESLALGRVSKALRAVLQLQAVHTVHLVGGKTLPVSELKPGDEIALRPGEECPADGLVSKGSASCSEAALSGESRPVQKQKADVVSSGTVILNGYMEVTLTTASSQSTLSKIEGQVEEAQMRRTDKHLMIQRFARVWTPSIVLLVLFISLGVPFLTSGDFQRWGRRGIVVLLTACPCAIVIGAPLATTCAIAAAASQGLLMKRPETVEKLPRIRAIALDKTGTLTKGELCVLSVEDLSESADGTSKEKPVKEETLSKETDEYSLTETSNETLLRMAAALELHSAHPIAAAIISKALGCIGELDFQELPVVENFQVLPGLGISAMVSVKEVSKVSKDVSSRQSKEVRDVQHKVLLGNQKALDDRPGHARFAAFQERHRHHFTVCMLVDDDLRLGLALNDTIREDSERFVAEFKAMGFRPAMLTGDTREAAAFVAETLQMDMESCHFAMSPNEKKDWVSSREAEGQAVLMVGDGINDATALAVASVGVAMGETGTALAAQSADIVMMTEKLHRLPQCVRLCRYAVRIERLNIVIPCFLKLLQASVAMVVDLKLWVVVLADLGTLLLALLLGVSILSPRFWKGNTFQTTARSRRSKRRLRHYEQFA